MPVKERSILGIDLRPTEIRVVEVRGSWPQIYIVRADAAPMPNGALENGRVVSPAAVAAALRGLVQRMGVGARDAVMGLPARVVTARALELPNVPDDEMPAILQGEIAHLHLQQEGESAFGFVRLAGGPQAAGNRVLVLLMSTESRIVSGYREVADLAGLRLIALEPILLSQFRAAYPQFGAGSIACLTIGPTRAEIIIADTDVRLYRRLEIGADDLIAGRRAAPGALPPPFVDIHGPLHHADVTTPPADWFEPETTPPSGSETFPPGGFKPPDPHAPMPAHLQSLTALIVELQRSLDYFRRTFPRLDPVEKIVIATSDAELGSIASTISQELGREVVLAAAPLTDPMSALTLRGPVEQRFVGAAGLAMYELPGHPAGVPRMDLSSTDRSNALMRAARRKMTIALAASIFLLAIGMGVALAIGTRANLIAHELGHEQEYLEGRQRLLRDQGVEQQAQNTRLAALQPRGIPLARIMDAVTGAVAPQVSLTAVSLDSGGRILVSGEAISDRDVIGTVKSLGASPYLDNPMVDSITNSSSQGTTPVVQFQISGRVANAPSEAAHIAPGAAR